MTRKCHNRCFDPKNLKEILDKSCVSACYHKYLNVMKRMQELSLEKGNKNESEFTTKLYPDPDTHLINFIWGLGGSKFMHFFVFLKYVDDIKIYPVKGLSPFREVLENQ